MIKEKVVYVTEDGESFDTKILAEEHSKLLKFKRDLKVYLAGKDIRKYLADEIFEFISENHRELYFMLSDLDEVN